MRIEDIIFVLPWLRAAAVAVVIAIVIVWFARLFSPKCPACREIIKRGAKRCKHCGESLQDHL